jgi:hypothetical protein
MDILPIVIVAGTVLLVGVIFYYLTASKHVPEPVIMCTEDAPLVNDKDAYHHHLLVIPYGLQSYQTPVICKYCKQQWSILNEGP